MTTFAYVSISMIFGLVYALALGAFDGWPFVASPLESRRARSWRIAVAFAIAFTALLLALASTSDPHRHTLYQWHPAPGSTATAETFIADYATALDETNIDDAMRARGWVLVCEECAEAGR